MTRREVLLRYRWLTEEASAMSRQTDRLIKIGAPAGIANQALTGMPRGTNDPQAAGIQAFDGYVNNLLSKISEIGNVCNEFEHTLEAIKDDRARTICRYYYATGMTDEQISHKVHLERSTVTDIRNDAVQSL